MDMCEVCGSMVQIKALHDWNSSMWRFPVVNCFATVNVFTLWNLRICCHQAEESCIFVTDKKKPLPADSHSQNSTHQYVWLGASLFLGETGFLE